MPKTRASTQMPRFSKTGSLTAGKGIYACIGNNNQKRRLLKLDLSALIDFINPQLSLLH